MYGVFFEQVERDTGLDKRESNDPDSLVKEPKAKEKGATNTQAGLWETWRKPKIGKENVDLEPSNLAADALRGTVLSR